MFNKAKKEKAQNEEQKAADAMVSAAMDELTK